MNASDFLAIMCPSCDTVEVVPVERLHVCTFCGTTIFPEENRGGERAGDRMTTIPVIMDAADHERAPVSLATDVRRALAQKLANAQADAAEDRAALKQTRVQLTACRRALRAVYRERDSLSEQVELLRDENRQMSAQLATVDALTHDAAAQMVAMRERCRTAEQMAAHWRAEVERLERELADATVAAARRMSEQDALRHDIECRGALVECA